MNNTWIVVPIIDSAFNYSTLMSTLKGGYTPSDIVTETVDEEGNTVITTEPHPNVGMTAPDFSNKIVLGHHTAGYPATPGAIDVLVEGDFNIAKLWNAGVEEALDNGATHAAVLNYISNLNPFVIEEAVVQAETVDLINIADGGLFVIKTTSGLKADEQFSVYFADLDLFATTSSSARASAEVSEIVTFNVDEFIAGMSEKIVNDGALYEAKHA